MTKSDNIFLQVNTSTKYYIKIWNLLQTTLKMNLVTKSSSHVADVNLFCIMVCILYVLLWVSDSQLV